MISESEQNEVERGLLEKARRIYRALEMSAGIMRDTRRTGGWEGAERTASAFERQGIDAKELHAGLTDLLSQLSKLKEENERLSDMASVGDDLLERIADVRRCPGWEHWLPADGPGEIVCDLLNALSDAETELSKARERVAGLEEGVKKANADADMYANAWDRELCPYGIRRKTHHIDEMVVTTRKLVSDVVGVRKTLRLIEAWKVEAATARTLGIPEPDLLSALLQPETVKP